MKQQNYSASAILFAVMLFANIANAQTFNVTNSGNVGIGTTTANSKLEIIPANANALTIRAYGTAAGSTGQLQFRELDAKGTNYVALKAPDSLTANYIYKLPVNYGTTGQVLTTNGAGVMSWATVTGSGTAGATVTLNNLTSPTAVNQSLIPSANNSNDFGSSGKGWKNIYLNKNIYLGGTQFLGTTTLGGVRNTLLGSGALFNNTGSDNTAAGNSALILNTIGDHNAAFGSQAMFSNTTGVNNVAVGAQALTSNSTGYWNTATGSVALYVNDIGIGNTANGYAALYLNTSGGENTAMGHGALYSNTTASNNTATGSLALFNNTTGYGNTAHGYGAGFNNTTGFNNCFIGDSAGYSNTEGSKNIAIGIHSLYSNEFGIENTALGAGAGDGNTQGSRNDFIGVNAGPSNCCLNFASALGSNTLVNASGKVRIGSIVITMVECQTGMWTTSDGRFKTNITDEVKGLEFIKKLHPVVYNFDTKKFDEFLMQNMSDERKQERMKGVDYAPSTNMRQTGFVAQEVEQAAKDCGYNFSGVHHAETKEDNWSLSYEKFVVPLVKSVQELDAINTVKDEQIKNLQTANDEMKNEIAQMKAMMQQFNQSLNECCNNFQSSNGNVQLAIGNHQNDVAKLEQNQPNPFNENTIIRFYIPLSAKNALVKIADANSKEIKSVEIAERGASQITISSNTLAAGVYTYRLIVDGKAVDTKKMTLTK
ncbi:MAG: tail fiber domain-containing protein [Bacteroidia bacterium]